MSNSKFKVTVEKTATKTKLSFNISVPTIYSAGYICDEAKTLDAAYAKALQVARKTSSKVITVNET